MKLITTKVHPNSRESSVKKTDKNILEVRVKSAPDKGKANREAVVVLSEFLNIPKSAITLVRGSKSKNKIFAINE
jgi:uncharacterized protein